MIRAQLDGLVSSGRITGYTVEEDSSYLCAHIPTLTYRMYMDGPTSHLNLGAFASAMGELAMTMKLSRVHGTVGHGGVLVRSRQLCLTAEFADEREIGAAMAVIHARFVAAPTAAPGSWHFPDVRVTGALPAASAKAFAHHWGTGRATAVALTLDPQSPMEGATTVPVQVLPSWVDYLSGGSLGLTEIRQSLALSLP
jgi:hypothetical protein